MSETLKPCPRCGGTNARLISGTGRDGKYYAVVIPDCDCGTVKWCDSDEAAIAWWNTRAPDPDLLEAREIIALLEREVLLAPYPYTNIRLETVNRARRFIARTDPQYRMSEANTEPPKEKPEMEVKL